MSSPHAPDATDAPWRMLIELQQRAAAALDTIELAFLVANETWQLTPYRQGVLFLRDALGRPQLKAISGLVSALEDTPYTLWLRQVRAAAAALAGREARQLTATDLAPELHEGWREWWPAHAWWQPLVTPSGELLGEAIYLREEPWTEAERGLLGVLHRHYAHCLAAFQPRPSALRRAWRGSAFGSRPWRAALLALALLASVPVRLSVIAPAEIIALNAEAIAAPADGVVKSFRVPPNAAVKAGEALFDLDDTTLRNRRTIAQRALEVARADALVAEQKSFDNPQSRSELAALQGRVREKEADLAYLDELLGRVTVSAAHDGIFVYGDPNDWTGKPVATGERIGQLAQSAPLGVLVWVPVGDAIALEAGAPIRIYLQVAPLDALSATLVQTSYQALQSPDGVASYRIRGALAAGEQAHIGLRGVAKIYGERQPLGYWVLRRPLGALRQRLGL